jgi:hypothetical protein
MQARVGIKNVRRVKGETHRQHMVYAAHMRSVQQHQFFAAYN